LVRPEPLLLLFGCQIFWYRFFLARISHQFRRCQVQSFWQIIIVGYFFCQNTEEDDAA
jgi:hypothetical protein